MRRSRRTRQLLYRQTVTFLADLVRFLQPFGIIKEMIKLALSISTKLFPRGVKMIRSITGDNFITINTNEKDGYYIIDVAGEIIGNSAESLLHLIDNAFLKTKSLRLMLDLRKVTYINSYSYGIIAYLWRVVRESGRKLYIVANSIIKSKFDRFGFSEKADLKIINPDNAPSTEMPFRRNV
jgi:anti-anti-sigma factor